MLVSFDEVIREVRLLRENEAAPESATRVAWLTPGFINAHCHLEYSWLAGKMPRGKIPFGQWMRSIMSSHPTDDETLKIKHQSMQAGAHALLAGGCTMVWDSTTDGESASILQAAGLPYFLLQEVLGLTDQRARFFWNRISSASDGINPHAPYSVGPWLRKQLLASPVIGKIQAWHLAETPDEEELFHTAAGSIAKLYRDFGLPMPFEEIPRTSSFEFLRHEGMLDHCDVAFHGNRLSLEEAAFFKSPRALVHCPGTHRWFQRDPLPLRPWIDAGVNLCLGTDSLASSDSLSMLEMIRIVTQDHPSITPDEILQMACTNPAKVMHAAEKMGTLKVGSRANMASLGGRGRRDGSNAEPDWRVLFDDNATEIERVWIAGKVGYGQEV